MKIKNMMPLVSRKVIWTEIIGTGLIMLVMLADNHQRFSNDLSYELFMAGIYSASHKIADINVMLAGRFRMILYYLVLCVFLGIDNYFSGALICKSGRSRPTRPSPSLWREGNREGKAYP